MRCHMKLAILLSGGKDSLLSAFMARAYHEVECAITIESRNDASYMFHTPNIEMTSHLEYDSFIGGCNFGW